MYNIKQLAIQPQRLSVWYGQVSHRTPIDFNGSFDTRSFCRVLVICTFTHMREGFREVS